MTRGHVLALLPLALIERLQQIQGELRDALGYSSKKLAGPQDND